MSCDALMKRRFNMDEMWRRRRWSSIASWSWGWHGEDDPGYEWDDWPSTHTWDRHHDGATSNQESYLKEDRTETEYEGDSKGKQFTRRAGENVKCSEDSENWNYETNVAALSVEENLDGKQWNKYYNKGWPSRILEKNKHPHRKEKRNGRQRSEYYNKRLPSGKPEEKKYPRQKRRMYEKRMGVAKTRFERQLESGELVHWGNISGYEKV